MNIFLYSAAIQTRFNVSFPDYEVLTTFAGDFAIADCYGKSSILDTLKRAWAEWSKDYKWATEIIMVLNFMCWHHHDTGRLELSRIYSDLYYEYKDKFYDLYTDNEEACDYFFEITN